MENSLGVKLIHRTVRTYLDKKGWQTLGILQGESGVGHESFYVELCTRYLHRLLRHCNLEKNTRIQTWMEWFDKNCFYGPRKRILPMGKSGHMFPFYVYAACHIFEHALSLEGHGASSYEVLHNSWTEHLAGLHYFCCRGCIMLPSDHVFGGFDMIYSAFSHGLTLYCKPDLEHRSPSPGPHFWERALTCALSSSDLNVIDALQFQEVVSLALQNVTSVQQSHLEQVLKLDKWWRSGYEEVRRMVLQHDSVKTLSLVDSNGQAVTLLWFFTKPIYGSWDNRVRFLNLLIEGANRRGENVRQRCCTEGNVVETLLRQTPNSERRKKLRLLREYYESMFWPFEYDLDEVETSDEYLAR